MIKSWQFACVMLLAFVPVVTPSPVKTSEHDSYDEFLKGDLAGLSVDSSGSVRLARAVTPIGSLSESIVWCLIVDASGTSYAGTGADGRVVKITPDGKTSVLFDCDETNITALAQDPSGALFAASSPHGKVYRIDPAGKGETYAALDDKYIWALAVDSAGNLYAGTGDKGVIRKISRSKEASAFFTTGESNIVALAFDAAGNLLAGGDTRGALYRITPAGKGTGIWSTDLREIRAILPRADGTIVVAATDATREAAVPVAPTIRTGTPSEPPPSTGTTPVVTTTVESEGMAGAAMSAAVAAARGAGAEKKARSVVAAVQSDGSSRELWRSADDNLYAVAESGDGSYLIATGNRGRLYWVAADGSATGLVAEMDGEQVSSLERFGKSRVLCATNNRAGLYLVSDAPAREGSLISDVVDTGSPSLWGQMRWRMRGSAGISLTTRSGNTPVPDTTWSDWSPPLRSAAGENISSPPARYLQWKASFTPPAQGEPPELDTVTLSYRQRNAPPRISSLSLLEPGVVYQKSFSTGEGEFQGGEGVRPPDLPAVTPQAPGVQISAPPAMGKQIRVRGLQTIIWTADDPNDDRLQYAVSLRMGDEKTWRQLRAAYDQTALVIDTSALPDGVYRVKVEASDQLSNATRDALNDSRESPPFTVDNTPPRISPAAQGSGGLSISDALTPIRDIAYAVNAGEWQPLVPKDGLCDGMEETVEVPKAKPGDLVVVRAIDGRGNFAVHKVAQ